MRFSDFEEKANDLEAINREQALQVINELKKKEDMKIITTGGRIITRKKLFEEKELFHKKLAHLRFERKIRMLVQLQKITDFVLRLPKKKQRDWKIFPKSSDEGSDYLCF